MTILSKIRNAPYAILAAATVAAYSSPAFAETTNIGGAAKGLTDDLKSVGKLIVLGSVVGGVVMLGAGLMKLKQAADTQGQQVKYSEGMWRLAVGAGLVGIPALSGMLAQTIGLDAVGIKQAESF